MIEISRSGERAAAAEGMDPAVRYGVVSQRGALEHFPSLLNRVGFPRRERSDSSHVLAEEAGMHGECAVG